MMVSAANLRHLYPATQVQCLRQEPEPVGAADLGPPDDQSEGTSGSSISDPPGVVAVASGEGGRGLPLNLSPVGLVGGLAGPAEAQVDPDPMSAER